MDKLRTPAVELLESRIAPATFFVTSLDDVGPGSLGETVAKANDNVGADTIAFSRGLAGTINLSSGQIAITDRLTITWRERNFLFPDAVLTLKGCKVAANFGSSGKQIEEA